MRKLLSYFLIILGAVLLLLTFFIKGVLEVELFERAFEIPLRLISGLIGFLLIIAGVRLRKQKSPIPKDEA
ncbi:MAG: hypothetical protein HWE07_03745 [Cytophagia bacterium]|nr:hypothetical protein [Cytophagia bacterium]